MSRDNASIERVRHDGCDKGSREGRQAWTSDVERGSAWQVQSFALRMILEIFVGEGS